MTDIAGRRVLLTGGAGFLGRRVAAGLTTAGASDVIVPRRADVDLTEQAGVRSLFERERPDVVMHLAAEVGGIGANQANPGRYFYANAAMGLHVIETARVVGAKVVMVGTVCSYPKHTAVPFRESDLWNGYPEETNAPYGIAKKALLVMLQAYHAQYGMPAAYLMPANLYGPGDNFDPFSSHVIPALIRRFAEAAEAGVREVTLWGTGTASREFLHVDDCAAAVVRSAEICNVPEPINIGTGQEITIRELAESVAEVTGYNGKIDWDASKPDGQPRRQLDTRHAREHLGFEPRITLTDGLRQTYEWWMTEGRSITPR